MGQDEQGFFVQDGLTKIEGQFSFSVSWSKKLCGKLKICITFCTPVKCFTSIL
jgi:hypothetical protein